MTGVAYVNGTVSPLGDAAVPMMDRGFLVGDGVFETMRTVGTAVFRLDDHAQRIQEGVETLGVTTDVKARFMEAVSSLVEAACAQHDGDLYVRVNMSMGNMVSITEGDGVSVTGIARPFEPHPHRSKSHGISVCFAQQRKDVDDPLSRIKHLSPLMFIAARRHALALDYDDALLMNTKRRVAEASAANVFARVGDVVHAPGPEEGAIPGVTRTAVLEVIQGDGIKVVDQLEVDDLARAAEVFLTNTTGGVMPVTRIEDETVGNGRPGAWTMSVQARLDSLLRGGT